MNDKVQKAVAFIFGFSGAIKLMKFNFIDFFGIRHQSRSLTEFNLINIFFFYIHIYPFLFTELTILSFYQVIQSCPFIYLL